MSLTDEVKAWLEDINVVLRGPPVEVDNVFEQDGKIVVIFSPLEAQ